jgi:hypothetical protein
MTKLKLMAIFPQLKEVNESPHSKQILDILLQFWSEITDNE